MNTQRHLPSGVSARARRRHRVPREGGLESHLGDGREVLKLPGIWMIWVSFCLAVAVAAVGVGLTIWFRLL